MKLADAYLCIECEEIFDYKGQTNPQCPSCTSRSHAPLSGWVPTGGLDEKLRIKRGGRPRTPPRIGPPANGNGQPAREREYPASISVSPYIFPRFDAPEG